jgi:hypothetical protein
MEIIPMTFSNLDLELIKKAESLFNKSLSYNNFVTKLDLLEELAESYEAKIYISNLSEAYLAKQ